MSIFRLIDSVKCLVMTQFNHNSWLVSNQFAVLSLLLWVLHKAVKYS